MITKSKMTVKKPYARLYALGEIRFKVICNELIKTDAQPYILAKKIQQEWKAHLDVSELVLGQQLNRFRKDLLAGNLPDAMGIVATDVITSKNAVLEEILAQEQLTGLKIPPPNPMNFLEELNILISQQKGRLIIALQREKEMNMPITQTDGIIKNLRDTIIEAQRVKFELGVDTYMMPIGGKGGISVTTVTPEGTVVNMQVTEAVNQATYILSNLASKGTLPTLIDITPD